MSGKDTVLQVLIDRANAGNRDWLIEHLPTYEPRREDLTWAANLGDIDKSSDVRYLAAAMWEQSDLPFEADNEQHLLQWMAGEKAETVRLLVALALYKRGNRNSAVVDNFWRACIHPDLAGIASKYKSTV